MNIILLYIIIPREKHRYLPSPWLQKLSEGLAFLHWGNYISISFHSEWDMTVGTVFGPNRIYIWLKTVTTIISHSLWKEMEI